jgi:ribosomal-protein-alanine N-acetyltransferase
MDVRFRIRPATQSDLARIAEIERMVFSDPWPATGFAALLGPFAFVAATAAGSPVGYVFGYRALDEGEILNLAVSPEYARMGIGTELVKTVLDAFARAGVRQVFLEVRESNAGARAFYERLGFEPVGRRKDYYAKPREDALVYTRAIGRG